MDARARRWIGSLGAVTAAIVLPFGYLGAVGLRNESRLADHGAILCAPVTARQISGDRIAERQVRYAFTIDGRTYRGSDETGRADLWQTVSLDAWERASTEGCVDVVYLPEDPRVSRPALGSATDPPVGNKIAALAMCGIALGLYGAATWGIAAVARTRRWRIAGADADGVDLVADGERRRVRLADVRGATHLVRPAARIHPPWRFESDVVRLHTAGGETLVVAPDADGDFAGLLASLHRRGALRVKRSS